MATQSFKSNNNEQRRKIRDSCNNCSAQKIRCSKQRPSCARCTNKSLQCNYSYSQRTGRRASSSNTQREQAAPSFMPTITDSPITSGDARSLFGVQASMTPTTSPPVAQASKSPLDSPNETYLNIFDDTNFFSELSIDLLLSPTIETATSQPSDSNNTAETTDAVLNLDTTSSYCEPSDEWNRPGAISTNADIALRTVHEPLHLEHDRAGLPVKSMDNTYQRGHDCMALALRVVYNLNVTREPCHIATSDPMAEIQSSQDELRDVDTVLFRNRDAARTIKKIMDCSCSADPTVSLACYLAATKIVDWYGAAIGAVDELSEKEGGNSTAIDRNVLRGAMIDRIIARPIFMGRYCLATEVQRAVRAQVVLSELKEHVQPLISRLPKYYVSGFDAGQDSSFSKDFNGSQSCILRNQLRTVIQIARNPSHKADS